jgi:hypothetical protein
MADGQVPEEPPQDLLVEYLGHQAHLGVQRDMLPVRGGNTRTFLSAVLESEEGEVSEPGYVHARSIDTEYTAAFAHLR